MNEKERDIGVLGSFFLTSLAVAVDGFQFLLTWIPAVGILFNTVISFFTAITFIVWFSYWHVSFLDGRYAVRGLSGLVAEVVPLISSFPVWTAVVIWILAGNRFRKKANAPSDV